MSYQAGAIRRLHRLWGFLKKGPIANKLKIAGIILVLIPCLSSISYLRTDNPVNTVQTQYEIKHAESLADVSIMQSADSPAIDISPAVMPDLIATPEPKPSNEVPETLIDQPTIMTYEVVSGDTLEGIARRHNTVTSYLLQINELDDPGALSIGQLINVPTPESGAPTPRPAPTQDPTIATAADIETLALMIHGEAHWESNDGKIAVGQCAYDRWKNTRRAEGQPYVWNPDGEMTLTEIITWDGQFAISEMTTICETCHSVARDVVSGTRAFRDYIVTNFRVSDNVGDWNSLPYLGHIGGHAFYGYER